jgi:rod shape-determining protein MreC
MYRRSAKQRLALAALIAASATVITLDFRQNPGGPVRRAQDWAVSVVAPLQDGVARVFEPVGDFLSSLTQIGSLSRENAELEREIEDLRTQLRRYPETVRENERLLALLSEKDWAKGERRGARVIGVGPSNYEWTAFIDVGQAQGIRENMSVVSAEGLVGRVVLAAEDYSHVLLLIDPAHAVGSRLSGSGDTGVMQGRGEEDLRFEFIDPDVKIDKGETVVTSGYDKGIYPPGIPIGRITSFRKAPSGLQQIAFVSPFVDFDKLDHVLVLMESGPVSQQTG